MRVAIAIATCAACGRIDFGTIARVDAGADAPAVGDAPDAAVAASFCAISAGTSMTELMTMDVATAQLTHVGYITSSFGQLGGLAYWDSNTLYATGSGVVVQITLSPFAATQVASGVGNISALERDDDTLLGLNQTSNAMVRFTPPYSNVSTVAFGTTISGGDIVKLSDGTWYYYSNASNQLFTFDATAGTATAVGPANAGGPFISGMVRDDSDHLFVTSDTVDALIALDTSTGQLGASVTLCARLSSSTQA